VHMHLPASLYCASAARHKHASSSFGGCFSQCPLSLSHRFSGKIPATPSSLASALAGVAKQVSVMLTYSTYCKLRPVTAGRWKDPAGARFASGGTKDGGTVRKYCPVLSCTFSRRESQAGGNGSALG
jgi:hypothetical protein